MKHKNTLIAAALLVVISTVVYVSCTKNKETASNQVGQTIMAKPQGKAAISRLLDFRKQVEAYEKNPDMKSGETLSLVDAVWNIENLFNLTYANPEDYYSETAEFEFNLYLPVDMQGEVLLTDLLSFYEQALNTTRTAYANTGFADKGFLIMAVEMGEQCGNTACINFRGKAGERCTQSNCHPHDSAMYAGPFEMDDYWQYADGMGKCDSSIIESGADKQIEFYLRDYISSLLEVSEMDCRPIYLNRLEITFDGSSAPTYAFYRSNPEATCIDFNNMNYYFEREKYYITEVLPNDLTSQVYGYVPISVSILGRALDDDNGITHFNWVTYAQRLVASISEVGEKQDLLTN